MLSTILIKNIAVIREAQISFERGFNVLTGETGAGKSILMDALQAVMGGRVSKEIIRTDSKSALVEAGFYFDENRVLPQGLEPYLVDSTVVISREIFRDGRNVVKINGSLSNTAVLRSIAPYLISIHSQNDNQLLFNEELHFRFLDHYAGSEETFLEYQKSYELYREVLSEIDETAKRAEDDHSRVDYLRFVIQEIENAHLLPDEEETLKNTKLLLKNREKNQQNIETATCALYENEDSAYNRISLAEQSAQKVEGLEAVAQRLCDLKYELAELSDTIRHHLSGVESEYQNLDELEDRLALIYQLKMKYGGTFDGIFSYYENASEELYRIEHQESHLKELEEKKEQLRLQLARLGEKLSNMRRNAAELLSKKLEQELSDLMMPNARFQIALEPQEAFRPFGVEKVRFLFSANLGMHPAPLSKIASGGEVSRVNLALKSVLRGVDPACAFVFDEIDTGLSGRAAQKTGEKMVAISQNAQVLCVTHLPQIAAMADHHILVSKQEAQGETVTVVHSVEEQERISELARMIGGVEVTELTHKNAEEILTMAKEFKSECSYAGSRKGD